MKNQVGGLVRALQAFQDLGINVMRIESRPSDKGEHQADFLVDIECEPRKVNIIMLWICTSHILSCTLSEQVIRKFIRSNYTTVIFLSG